MSPSLTPAPVAEKRSISLALQQPKNWLYVAASVALVGLLANQSGGYSESTHSTVDNAPGKVPVTVQLPTP